MANDNSEIQRRIDLLQEHKRWECIKCIVSLIASHQKYRILYMKSYVEAKALVSEMIKGAGLCEMSSENFKKRYQVLQSYNRILLLVKSCLIAKILLLNYYQKSFQNRL